MTWVATGTATLTAAEIAAAEAAAAAAATAAAEAAAAQAATQTAGTALVAEAAPALTQTAATVLPEVTSVAPEATGILEATPGVTPPPAQPLPPAGLEQIVPAGSTPPPVELSQAELDAVQQGLAEGNASGPSPYEPTASNNGTQLVEKAAQPPTTGTENVGRGFNPGTEPVRATTYNGYTPQELSTNYRPDLSYSTQVTPTTTNIPAGPSGPTPTPTPEPNSFLQGAKDVGAWMDSNPFKTGAIAYLGLQQTGAFNQKGTSAPPQKTFKNQYSLSPNFQGGPYSEPNIYKPRYAAGGIAQISSPVERMAQNAEGGATNMYPQSQQERTNFATPTQMPASAEVTMDNQYRGVTMAQGGVAGYARGDLVSTLDKYNEMIEGKKSDKLPSGKSDPYTGEVGTFEDNDTDTRLQDAYTAAQTRLKKAGKRANVGIAALPAGVQAGALSLPTQQAAGGGIMQANLGGYAAGGNPRLLKGPGDGMSDNIPATIGNRQPARLADGEFVVPADVVSHLGNGSTNAGAKKLHGMMDKVRMDRTGKKKQAPAVKAGKYIPK